MITINSYVVTERAVYEGVASALSKLMADPSEMPKPDKVVEGIAESVMNELASVFDFGIQPIRFSGDVMRKVWAQAEAEIAQPSDTMAAQ